LLSEVRTERKISRTQQGVGRLPHGAAHNGTGSVASLSLTFDQMGHMVHTSLIGQGTATKFHDHIDALRSIVVTFIYNMFFVQEETGEDTREG
jgi:hypothetical protein